jgi:hypothetical protein
MRKYFHNRLTLRCGCKKLHCSKNSRIKFYPPSYETFNFSNQLTSTPNKDGRSHALRPVAYPGYGALNPRNGASRPYAGDGLAAVVFLDGHSEMLTAEQCKTLSTNATDAFWGK